MLYNIFDFAVFKNTATGHKRINKELNTLISLMSLSAEATEVVSERANVAGNWGLIGSTVVTGIVIVFLILAILIFFLWAMGKIFQSIDASKKKKIEQKAAEKVSSAPVPAVQSVPVEIYEDDEEDDDEIIAVISAAIAAYGEAEGKQYRICGVKKREKSQRSGWSAAGIADNMRGF